MLLNHISYIVLMIDAVRGENTEQDMHPCCEQALGSELQSW